MINLIPSEEKRLMVRDFYLRLLAIIFIMFGLLALMVCVIMVPSFILSVEKKNAINQKIEMQTKEIMPEIDQQALNVINDLNDKLVLINKSKQVRYDVSQKVVKEILSKKTLGIKITQIFYTNDNSGKKNIIVNGQAKNREELLIFRKLLEDDKAFSKVNLPISNFVKDSDLDFNLNLIPS